MRSPRNRARSLILGVSAVLAAVTVSVSPASAQQDGSGIVPEGDYSQAEIDWMVNWIADNEATLPANYPTSYSDGGSQLEAMGYVNFGATAPGGYDHWIHQGRLFDQHILNPLYPESLVYRSTGGGEWVLEAGMYMLAPGVEMDDIPGLISWIPGWHGHPELCVSDQDGSFAGITDPDNPDCPPGTHQATTPVMVHAWLVDPGCGHRFGGVGVGGLHCDVSH